MPNDKKNITRKPTVKEKKPWTPAIKAQIDKMVDVDGSKVKAYASVTLGGVFAVHGISVMDSDNGYYVAMPARSYQKDGKTEYADVFHPIASESRKALDSAIMQEFMQKLQEDVTEDMDQDLDEDALPFEQTM